MKSIVEQHTSYNVWANTIIVEQLTQHPDLLDIEVKSSFATLRKTLLHIWDAEYIWLQRLKGESIENWPSKDFEPGISLGKMVENSGAFNTFVKEQEETFFSSSTVYKNLKGDSFTTSNHGIIMHCMNHSTFHRGQLVTMLRGLGHEGTLPSTDLITFLRWGK